MKQITIELKDINSNPFKKEISKGIFDGTVTENDKKKQISSKISSLKTQLQIPFVFRNKGLGRRRYLCAEFEKEFFKEQYEKRIDTFRYIQEILDKKSQVTEEDLEKEKIVENEVGYYSKKN